MTSSTTGPARGTSNARIVGVALVVISACGFGSGALFAKPVYGAGVDWLTLLFWRFLIAAVLSWAWLLLVPGNRATLALLTRRRVLVLLALGSFYVLNSGTYFAALETVPASLAALIVYIYPALVAVLSLRFGRPLRGRRAWFALGISTLGVALAVGGISADAVPPLSGLLLALASPVIYAVWIILAARLAGERPDRDDQGARTGAAIPPQDAEAAPDTEGTDPAPAAALMMTATATIFFLAMLGTGRSIAPASMPSAAWPGIVGVAVFSTALAVQAFYAGSRRIGAARAALVSTVEPVYTIVLATLIFGETLTTVQILGGVLVIGGVLLAESGSGQMAERPVASTSPATGI